MHCMYSKSTSNDKLLPKTLTVTDRSTLVVALNYIPTGNTTSQYVRPPT